jgi:hypothetical protein
MPHPGGTWTSPFTPMTDFPLMNSNQDAMMLFALLRVCGIEPSMKGDGLTIAPKAPPERFVLDTQLLKLEVEPGRIAGEYRPIVGGSRTFHVRVPGKPNTITASIEDQQVAGVAADNPEVDLKLTFTDKPVRFEVRWNV